MGRIIGIDLGTTNSAVAIYEEGKARLIPTSGGLDGDGYLIPSVVAIKNGERFVGRAVSKEAVEPANTITSIKRFMGRKYDEIDGNNKELRKATELATYELIPAENGDIWVRIDARDYSPSEISAMILGRLKASAEEHLKETVDQAVISVPAYFNDAQRNATKDAGKIAGLEVLRIINEPTAASLAYGIDRNRDGNIAVYDLGGGTFDISILKIQDGIFDVLSTDGDAFLGGDDFDAPIVDWLAMQFERAYDIELLADAKAKARLRQEAKEAKHKLSSVEQVVIDLPNIAMIHGEATDFATTLTQSQLAELVIYPGGPIERTLERCKEALIAAGLSPDDIDAVLLVGGMTKMPAVRAAVKGYFGKEPMANISPDEAVALGAAIQAGVMGGDVTGIALLDVTPLNLGVEVRGDLVSWIIERNTTIPVKRSRSNYSTVEDNQTSIFINVVQGVRPLASENKSLGSFHLRNIPPAQRGEPTFEFTFTIDANGIIQVAARDVDSSQAKHLTIRADSGLTSEEVARAMAEAERYAQEDETRKQKAEADNAADIKVYHARTLLRDHRDKLERVDISRLEFLIEATEEARKNGTADEINAASEELVRHTRELGQKMYR